MTPELFRVLNYSESKVAKDKRVFKDKDDIYSRDDIERCYLVLLKMLPVYDPQRDWYDFSKSTIL